VQDTVSMTTDAPSPPPPDLKPYLDLTPESMKDDPEQAVALARVRQAYHRGGRPLTLATLRRDMLLREERQRGESS